MNKLILAGALLGSTGIATSTALLMQHQTPGYAEVLTVTPLTETVSTPREVCQEREVTRQQPSKDPHRVTGSVVGAVVGGLLGNQVGGGSGKKIATVAGAAAGGYAGNKVQENLQASNTYTTTETHCQTVTDTEEKLMGYQVQYRLGDKTGTVRMAQKPGERIPVKDGELLL